jgi:hypothetical protein
MKKSVKEVIPVRSSTVISEAFLSSAARTAIFHDASSSRIAAALGAAAFFGLASGLAGAFADAFAVALTTAFAVLFAGARLLRGVVLFLLLTSF